MHRPRPFWSFIYLAALHNYANVNIKVRNGCGRATGWLSRAESGPETRNHVAHGVECRGEKPAPRVWVRKMGPVSRCRVFGKISPPRAAEQMQADIRCEKKQMAGGKWGLKS